MSSEIGRSEIGRAEIERIIEDYLRRLRRGLRGASPDVGHEAEMEIRAHVEDGLDAMAEPSLPALLALLERLGRPEELGRDMALYMMVDRGYREWSLPHMLRSTAFWALTTVAGAVVVLIFGLLYALSAALVLGGLLGSLARVGLLDLAGLPGSALPGLPALVLGLAGLGLLTVAVRWFVGQYVRHAGPKAGHGSAEGDEAGWARRAERRILLTASAGLAIHLSAGFASGIYGFGVAPGPVIILSRRLSDFSASPLALLSTLGLVGLGLAPILGVIGASRSGARRS
jgi:hypothetical protein